MAFTSRKSRITLFFVMGVGLSLAMALLKATIAWLVETYLYSVPWVGGFLRSVELGELSNWVAFALLGLGIGSATYLLPRRWDHRAKLGFLALVSPFVFMGSYLMHHHLWIRQVASNAQVSYEDAKAMTNAYLKRETGRAGFWGYFPLSTQLSELPTQPRALAASQSANSVQALTQELESYDDARANLAAFVFKRIGWFIRFIFILLAGVTGLIYYFKGHVWAERRRYGLALGSDTDEANANTVERTGPLPGSKLPQKSRTSSGSQISGATTNRPSNAPSKLPTKASPNRAAKAKPPRVKRNSAQGRRQQSNGSRLSRIWPFASISLGKAKARKISASQKASRKASSKTAKASQQPPTPSPTQSTQTNGKASKPNARPASRLETQPYSPSTPPANPNFSPAPKQPEGAPHQPEQNGDTDSTSPDV